MHTERNGVVLSTIAVNIVMAMTPTAHFPAVFDGTISPVLRLIRMPPMRISRSRRSSTATNQSGNHPLTSRATAIAARLTLSARGSRIRPHSDSACSHRARSPSSLSVRAARTSQNTPHQRASGRPEKIVTRNTSTSSTRRTLSAFGIVQRSRFMLILALPDIDRDGILPAEAGGTILFPVFGGG